jgi:MurNAc alpha-1-phosphate uridylyltransferase
MITAHVAARTKPAVAISDETALLLETGGGVVKALPLLGEAPFFVLNCDAIIKDRGHPALRRLAEAWDPQNQDVLMLLHPLEAAHGFDGAGDFFLRPDGALSRRGAAASAPFVYAGAYIMHPRILAGEEAVPFSMNRIWDRAIAGGRMQGLVHDGDWYHVGTPEAVGATEQLLGFREPAIS